jgi:hypothetical protein
MIINYRDSLFKILDLIYYYIFLINYFKNFLNFFFRSIKGSNYINSLRKLRLVIIIKKINKIKLKLLEDTFI